MTISMVSALIKNKNQCHNFWTYFQNIQSVQWKPLNFIATDITKEVCLKTSLQSNDLEQIYLASNL